MNEDRDSTAHEGDVRATEDASIGSTDGPLQPISGDRHHGADGARDALAWSLRRLALITRLVAGDDAGGGTGRVTAGDERPRLQALADRHGPQAAKSAHTLQPPWASSWRNPLRPHGSP